MNEAAIHPHAQCFDAPYFDSLRQGQQDAEATLYAAFTPRLKRALRSRLRSPDAVEDACQETMLRVLLYFHSGKTLRTPGSLPAFIESVGKHVALEFVRAGMRHSPLPDSLMELADPAANPEYECLQHERKALVLQALEKFRETDRSLLRDLLLNDKERKLICEEFHVNRRHLRLLIFRARARCRQVMEAAGFTG